VPEKPTKAAMALCCDITAAVVMPDSLSDSFSTTSGVLQGDTLAPFLFVLLLDWVLRSALPTMDDGFVLCRCTSSRHPEKRLSVLAYADDLALLSCDEEGAQRLLYRLTATAGEVGLAVNATKTEKLTVPADIQTEIHLWKMNSQPVLLSHCGKFTYLGRTVLDVDKDRARRRGLAFRFILTVLRSSELPDRLRGRLFGAVI
jgi:hypothetical protein